MKLLFKQRLFSWLDSYDIYGEDGERLFRVEGRLALGHCLHILDSRGRHIGTVREKVLRWLPTFELYENDRRIGRIRKEFTLFRPRFTIDCKDWRIDGDWAEWDYTINDGGGRPVARVSKALFRLTDTYVIDVADPGDALPALMVTLAIDAEKCSRN